MQPFTHFQREVCQFFREILVGLLSLTLPVGGLQIVISVVAYRLLQICFWQRLLLLRRKFTFLPVAVVITRFHGSSGRFFQLIFV